MKTVLTAAAVATLTLTPNLPAQADNINEIKALYATGQRKPRREREERLREAQRHSSRARRKTRHEREERLREAGWEFR